MSKPHDTRVELAAAITRKLTDEGKIIEAGFASLVMMAYPPDLPAAQRDEMRNVFFAGAQHLLASIASFLEPGDEPTENDMLRMQMIDTELRRFISEFVQRRRAPGHA